MPRPKKESPNRKDGRYEVKITIGRTLQGKLIRKSFYSDISKADAKKQAEKWKIEQKVCELTGANTVTETCSFERWANTWLEVHKKPAVRAKTYEETYKSTVERYLLPQFGKANLSSILPSDIISFYAKIAKKYSDSLLSKCRLCLNGIFETAIDEGLLYRNPAAKVKLPPSQKTYRERRPLTEEEEATVRTFCLEHRFGLEVLILLELGLRRGELCGLRWDDIDFDNLTVQIQRKVSRTKTDGVQVGPTKTKNSKRTLPLKEEFAEFLYSFRGAGYIISGASPIDPHTWANKHFKIFWRDLQAQRPEIGEFTPHEMRHTCGTRLYEQTHDIYAVSKFLGHSSIEITARYYVHSNVETLRTSLNIGNECRQGVVNTQNGPLRTLRKNTSKKTKTA